MVLLLVQTKPLGVSLPFSCLYTLSSSSVSLPSKHIWVWTILSNFGPSQNIVPPRAFRCYKNPTWSVSPTSSFTVFLFTHFALVSLALSGLKFPSLDVPQGLCIWHSLCLECFVSRYRHVFSSCFNLIWPLTSVPQRVLSWSFYPKQTCPPHHSSWTTSCPA